MLRRTIVMMIATITFVAMTTVEAASLGSKVLKGAAVGYAVKQSAGSLDSFINKVTLQHGMPQNLETKVIPILSVGDKGYVGGAQVSGPAHLVKQVQAVFQYEQSFDKSQYRIKGLVPSASLNPVQLQRVEGVGVTALIDVALAGGLKNNYVGDGIGASDVLKAAVVAVGIKSAASQLNSAINTITFNKGAVTAVVPMASFGEKAYIGGGQVSGSMQAVNDVAALWQYEDLFANGRFRVKVLVPTDSTNPLKMKRIHGAGISAVVDTTIDKQVDVRKTKPRKDSLKRPGLILGKPGR